MSSLLEHKFHRGLIFGLADFGKILCFITYDQTFFFLNIEPVGPILLYCIQHYSTVSVFAETEPRTFAVDALTISAANYLVTSHPKGYITSTRLRLAHYQNCVGPIKIYIFYKKCSTLMRRFYILNHYGFIQEPIVCGGK